ARAVRSGIDVTVRRAYGDAESVPDIGNCGVPRFVVANETGKNGEPCGVGGGPAVGTAVVRIHVEEGTRASQPSSLACIVEDVVELVEIVVRAVDDDQVTILLAALVDVARRAAFDPVRLRNRLRGNRIERQPLSRRIIDAVAL